MSKTSNWIQIVLFTAFIAVFFILFLATPDVKFSEQENRELSQVPAFSFEKLFSGKFTESFESYTTDQFPLRDSWITVKARTELLAGKKSNKGVYLCAGDMLIEAFVKPDDKQLETNIDAVSAFSESADVPVYFALIPGAAEIYSNLLPKDAPNYSQREVIDWCYERSGANNIDLYTILSEHKGEYIFYRTDHHWTSLGAFYGYTALMDGMGEISSSMMSFTRQVVSDEFYGTVYSKSGITWVKSDTIEIFAKQEPSTTVMNYSDGEGVVTALYDESFLDKKDKYSMFLGGITPMVTIKTGAADAPSLLIVRDSYTDSLAPFFQDNFSNIFIIDLRYYKSQLMQQSLKDFIAQNGVDEVLICYSVSNFASDTNVFLLGT
ncbi:MAG: hypothetical protein EOM14_04135 [Clostridia bacterium]|nr:hypothetical protein [Clostridia bacterium]